MEISNAIPRAIPVQTSSGLLQEVLLRIYEGISVGNTEGIPGEGFSKRIPKRISKVIPGVSGTFQKIPGEISEEILEIWISEKKHQKSY